MITFNKKTSDYSVGFGIQVEQTEKTNVERYNWYLDDNDDENDVFLTPKSNSIIVFDKETGEYADSARVVKQKTPVPNTNNKIVRRVSSLNEDEITKRQIEELVHNKIGKFVKETFKNELTRTNIESIEQHKYARLSKGSYMTYRGENVEKMLKDFKPTKNFIVDTELTNANATVFHDVKTGETVIAYRGTDPGSLNLNEIEKTKLPNFSDLKTDGAILMRVAGHCLSLQHLTTDADNGK